MCAKKNSELLNLKKYLLTREEAEKIAKDFRNEMITYLKKHCKNMFTLKGAPGIQGISTTFGPYVGKNLALYLSKNPKKPKIRGMDLRKFYSEIDKAVTKKIGSEVYWRSNLLIDRDTGASIEVEFIPLAFRGSFLLEVLKKSEMHIMDRFMLVHSAVITLGNLFNEAIVAKGYSSTHPRIIKDMERENPESFTKEIEEADFYIDLQFTEKSAFSLSESELIAKSSESSLERRVGLELIKEAIPILIQHEIKADFPKQKSRTVVAKPDFIILNPSRPAAIFCDSYRYHQRKKDQIFKDRRIDRKLQKMGFLVFRFSEEEISKNLEGCLEEIKEYYLGKEYSLSSREVLMRKLTRIDPSKISEWERRFIEMVDVKLSEGKGISLKEERILNKILDKLHLNY
jgi:hypothetical protein